MIIDNWEYNVLGVYNYRTKGKLDNYYKWIIKNIDKIKGDIVEAGVFRGKSLLATAMLLKELGSDKKVYGFDSFSGFPAVYHENDNLARFDDLYKQGKIDSEHYSAHQKLKKYRALEKNAPVTVENISSSTDFSNTNKELILQKAKLLELDNIVLISGDFSKSMANSNLPDLRIMAALMDCDLYSSYQVALPFIWSRLSCMGYIFLDEYYSLKFPGARMACDEFFSTLTEKPTRHSRELMEFERWYVIKNS